MNLPWIHRRPRVDRSALAGKLVIRDDTDLADFTPADRARGLDLRRPLFGRAYEGVADPFPDSLIIPRAEQRDWIEDRKKTRRFLRDRLIAGGVKVKDQGRTNYCWINAPTFTVECRRFQQHDRHVVLSPASAGARIKNFRNSGGWGLEGLQFIAENGVCPVDLWPANAIERRYDTPENREAAKAYRVDEWWELEPRNLDHLFSCVMRGFPVAVGYNWWRHEVTAIDFDWVDGDLALVIANSWGEGWGEKGFGLIQGRKILPDDAVAPRTAKAA